MLFNLPLEISFIHYLRVSLWTTSKIKLIIDSRKLIISAVNYLRIIDFFSFERNEDANFLLNFLESKRITNTSSLKIYAIIFSIERATTVMRRSKMGKSAWYGKIISIFPFLHLKIEFSPPLIAPKRYARCVQGRAWNRGNRGTGGGKRAILSRIAAERGFYRGFIHEESGCGTGAGL